MPHPGGGRECPPPKKKEVKIAKINENVYKLFLFNLKNCAHPPKNSVYCLAWAQFLATANKEVIKLNTNYIFCLDK